MLLSAALARHAAVIAVFVTRPNETVPTVPPWGLRRPERRRRACTACCAAREKGPTGNDRPPGKRSCLCLCPGDAAAARKEGIDLEAYYVASAELFDMLSPARREKAFPEDAAARAHGDHRLHPAHDAPLDHGERGRRWTLHPFRKGHFLGSGQAERVMKEAGLDGRGQLAAIKGFLPRAMRTGA